MFTEHEIQGAFWLLEGNWETVKSAGIKRSEFQTLLRKKTVRAEQVFPGCPDYPGDKAKPLRTLFKNLLVKYKKHGEDAAFLQFRETISDFEDSLDL